MRLMAEPLVAGRVNTGLLRDFGTWMTSEQRRVNALCRRLLHDPDDFPMQLADDSILGQAQPTADLSGRQPLFEQLSQLFDALRRPGDDVHFSPVFCGPPSPHHNIRYHARGPMPSDI